MPECPYCGKWFKSKRGFGQHIIKTHTTKGLLGERTFNPFSIDVFGTAERRQKRALRKLKRNLLC